MPVQATEGEPVLALSLGHWGKVPGNLKLKASLGLSIPATRVQRVSSLPYSTSIEKNEGKKLSLTLPEGLLPGQYIRAVVSVTLSSCQVIWVQ